MPETAEEASVLAGKLVGTLLPPSMASWLEATELHALAHLPGKTQMAEPERTSDMVECISKTVGLLSEVLAPARQRPSELAELLGKMFAGFNLYTGDAAKVAAQVEVWGEELGEFPLYAIRQAYKWALRGEGKLPSLAAFISDVRLAVGSNVLTRKRMLERWISSPPVPLRNSANHE